MEPLTFRESLDIALRQPEYWHALLHPIVVCGLGFGLLAMVMAVLVRHRRGEVVALTLVAIGALAAWPVAEFGHRGYEQISVIADDDGRAWLEIHRDRAETVLPLFYVVAAVAAAALFAPRWWPRSRKPLFWLTFLLALGAIVAGSWISRAGGKVRHKEFRYAPPPPKATPFTCVDGRERTAV